MDLCYRTAGKVAEFVEVHEEIAQRSYFSFYDYEYVLDVTGQSELMPDIRPLTEGLKEAFIWYLANKEAVAKKPLMEYIDNNLV